MKLSLHQECSSVLESSKTKSFKIIRGKVHYHKKDYNLNTTNIFISNGINLVRPNNDGSYEIKVFPKKFPFVYIVAPGEYKIIDTFFYHILLDAWKREYNFTLQNSSEINKSKISFIQLSDLHIPFCSESDKKWIYQFWAHLDNINSDFIINTGDTINDSHDGINFAQKLLRQIRSDKYHVIGNHDFVTDSPKNNSNTDCYERNWGPVYYSFNRGNYHFVVLDSFCEEERNKQQLKWLAEDLAFHNKLQTVVFTHHYFDFSPALMRLLEIYQVKAVISGHIHSDKFEFKNNIGFFSSRMSLLPGYTLDFPACRLFNLSGKKLESKIILSGKKNELNLIADSDDSVLRLNNNCLLNAHCPETDSYEYQLPEENFWRPMTHAGGWLWQANIPARSKTVKLRTKNNLEEFTKNIDIKVQSNKTLNKVSPVSDWLTFQANNHRTGISRDHVTPPFNLSWVVNVGTKFHLSSPVIGNNKLFAGIIDDENGAKGGITALDIFTGNTKWKYITGESIANSPTMYKGNIYAVSSTGGVYAIDAENGLEIWRNKHNDFLNYSSPLLNDDVLYVLRQDGIYVLDIENGKTIDRLPGEKRIWSSYVSATAGTDFIYAGYAFEGFFAFYPQNNTMKWEWDLPDKISLTHCNPVFDSDIVYFAIDSHLFAVNALTGKYIWRFNIGKRTWPHIPASTPAVFESKVYIGSPFDGRMCALNSKSGSKLWEFQTGKSLLPFGYHKSGVQKNKFAPCILSSPTVSGELLFFGANDGTVYVLNRNSGKLVWSVNIGVPITSPVIISGNTIWVSSYDGNIYAFTAQH